MQCGMHNPAYPTGEEQLIILFIVKKSKILILDQNVDT